MLSLFGAVIPAQSEPFVKQALRGRFRFRQSEPFIKKRHGRFVTPWYL